MSGFRGILFQGVLCVEAMAANWPAGIAPSALLDVAL